MLKSTNYKGWVITFDPTRPVTGKYRATRFGVGLGAGTFDAVCRMIDAKIREQE